MSKKTTNPTFLKVIGFIFVGVALYGLINIIIGIRTLGINFVIGLYSFAISIIIAIPCLADGFRPEKERKQAKKELENYQKYYSEEPAIEQPAEPETNEIAQAIKDIVIETIEQNTVDTSEGKKPVKYCIDCGCAIDKNSNFCKICGKEQE